MLTLKDTSDTRASLGFAFQDLLAIGIQFQLDDGNVGRVDSDWNGCTVGLFTSDLVNVDNPLLTIAANYTTTVTLVVTASNLNLIFGTETTRPSYIFGNLRLTGLEQSEHYAWHGVPWTREPT